MPSPAVGGKATALPLDITDLAATDAAVSAHGPFDVLVNSAGLARPRPGARHHGRRL